MNHRAQLERSQPSTQPVSVPKTSGLSRSGPVFWTKYFFQNVFLAARLLFGGQWKRVFRSIHARIHNKLYWFIFAIVAPVIRKRYPPLPNGAVQVITNHPVAFTSPDHIAPYGTKYNNTTNRKFVLLLNKIVRQRLSGGVPGFLDLGCSGGQLVKDFRDLRWLSLGLEGSDYSLKTRRANWATLAGTHLFTCDITKPFQLKLDGQSIKFHLITAWEVMEHIHPDDLEQLFRNIRDSLAEGGYFIASTASGSSIQDGVELHQTQWTNDKWRQYIAQQHPDLKPVDLGLRIYQYVRYDFGEPSFLVYRKTSAS